MAARKFKFVSPGIFLKEIDNSQLPKLPGPIGPVIIGRTRKGPAMKPVTVNSYADFVEVFGEPVPGGQGDDVWREGNGLLAPAYAHYAAKAYFAANIQSPVTTIRLLGVQGDNATDPDGAAGWSAHQAWGLFVAESGSNKSQFSASCLAGIIYGETDFTASLSGQDLTGSSLTGRNDIMFLQNATDKTFTVHLNGHASGSRREIKVSFDRTSEYYIRNALNTNPVATNNKISFVTSGSLADKYWLGETFEENVPSGNLIGFMSRLRKADGVDLGDFSHEASAAQTGWVFCQDEGVNTAYNPDNLEKLFRIVALHEGEESSKTLSVSVEDIRIPEEGDPDPYGSFSIVVRRVFAAGNKEEVIESFAGCNLNPNSSNYVARQIGDQYQVWSSSEKRNKLYGNYPNNSRFIRMDMKPNVDNGLVSPSKVPFGFYGPVIPSDTKIRLKDSTGGPQSGFSGSFLHATMSVPALSLSQKAAGGVEQEFTVKWPRLPHVVSASVDGSDHFGAALYKKDSNNKLTSVIDRGYGEYLRKASEGLKSLQTSGLSGSGQGHSFVFSLDEVIVGGSNLTSISAANITSSFFMSGSRKNQGAVASFTFSTSVPGDATITLISNDGSGNTTSKTYIAKDDDGDANGTVSAGKVVFRRGSHASAGQRAAFAATSLKAAIDAAGGHNAGTTGSKFVVSTSGGTIKIIQAKPGILGRTTITTAANFTNATSTNPPETFEGGTTHAKASYTMSGSAATLLQLGFDKFRMPLVGGHDGVNVTEADPFNNRVVSGKTTADSYAYASIDRAIELIKDPEFIEHNLALMPGVTNESLTTKLVEKCESRADSLAIIDIPSVYKPPHELKCTNFQDRIATNPNAAATALKKRALNSSYGATYYPWVKIKDVESSRDLWVPPSVIALGVMAYTEEAEEVWFAPAGFNRGGLNEGNAGLPVLQVSEQLLSKQRDTLYAANINPIASFVTEGIVVFGQKTLQSTQSALDRINVRRLLIFVKKEISRIASGLLFDQNVPATWNRFLGQVNPFLQSVQTRLGLSDFKVILDNSTTTPDLVDRNVMYAKIFLKPARAIEFIAVDFVITNTGASFED